MDQHRLRIAGVLNLVGDVGLLAGGIKTKNPHKFTGGLLYTLGGLNLAHYGTVDKEHIINEVAQRVAEHMEHNGITPPDDTRLAAVLRQKDEGALAEVDRFLHRQPAKNTMVLYTAGAAAMFGSGIQQYRMGEGGAGLAYGATSLGVKLASLVIPETPVNATKQADPQKPKGVMQWVQEKPLRLFGYGSLASEAFLALASYQEYKRAPHKGGYMWTALSSASYMGADILLANAHKDVNNAGGQFTEDETRKLCELVSEVIVTQPVRTQDKLFNQFAEFISHQPEIRGDTNRIRPLLEQKTSPTPTITMAQASRSDVGVSSIALAR